MLMKYFYLLPNIYLLKDAPFTETALPCGAIEEVDKIKKLLKEYYDNDFNRDFYLINLIGHGSIMMSKNEKQLEDIEIVGRKIPEYMHQKKLVKK